MTMQNRNQRKDVFELLSLILSRFGDMPYSELPEKYEPALSICLAEPRWVRLTDQNRVIATPEGLAALELSEPVAEADSDSAFVSVTLLLQFDKRFDTYRKAKMFLDGCKDIRTRKPASNRLEVHAGDWIRYWAKQKTDKPAPIKIDDENVVDYLDAMDDFEKNNRDK